MSEFRYQITDCLYELVHPYEANDAPDYIAMWPIKKVTADYVWVHGPSHWNRDRTYRLSREKLEREGRAWSASAGHSLYVRPLPDWPLLVVDVRPAEVPALPQGGFQCSASPESQGHDHGQRRGTASSDPAGVRLRARGQPR